MSELQQQEFRTYIFSTEKQMKWFRDYRILTGR